MSAIAVPKRASFLELFLDLVFVFAVTQLAAMIRADHSAAGWGRAGLMAWLVWWAWSQFTWAGNAVDIEKRPVRAAVLGVTATTLLVAAAIPAAYGEAGAWFAAPYAVVRFAGLGLYSLGLRQDAAMRSGLRAYLPVALVSPAVVLVGGLAAASARPWIWLAAALIDVTSALAAGRGEFRVAPDHFAERHGLIVIIALGESIIAVGMAVAHAGLGSTVALTALSAVAVIACLWWAYFDWFQAAVERALAEADDLRRRGRLARDVFTFAHFPVVAGTVAFAAGVEEAVAHPGSPLDSFGLWAAAAGIGAVLAGFVAAHLRAARRLLPERALAAAAIAALAGAAGARLDAVGFLAALAGLLAAFLAMETARRSVGGAQSGTPATSP